MYHSLQNTSSRLTTGFFSLDIKYVSGSVEAACGLGLADAVIDLVETGTTMVVWISLSLYSMYSTSFINKLSPDRLPVFSFVTMLTIDFFTVDDIHSLTPTSHHPFNCVLLLKAAGLHVVDDVLVTEAIMISSKASQHPEIVELIKTRILGYMTATT